MYTNAQVMHDLGLMHLSVMLFSKTTFKCCDVIHPNTHEAGLVVFSSLQLFKILLWNSMLHYPSVFFGQCAFVSEKLKFH